MFKRFVRVLLSVLALSHFTPVAEAQISQPRTNQIAFYRVTVGTTAALAIPAANVQSSLIGWEVCNDGINASTYLAIGEAADPLTDGKRILPGACLKCEHCTAGTLKQLRVVGQAAANGYSVVQYKQ